MYEIICSGFGGQGVLTAGLLLIEAGAAQERFVSWCPSYGSEMRGGTANCNVIISEEEVGSPYVTEADILIAMNEPSVDKFLHVVKSGGLVLLNSSMIPLYKDIPDHLRVMHIAATDIANELENPRGTNIVMLGALMKATRMFDSAGFAEVIAGYFRKKGYDNPRNLLCYNKGYEIA